MSLKLQRFRGINERKCKREEFTQLYRRLDRIIQLLEDAGKKPPLAIRIANGAATGVGIAGIVAVIDIIKGWIGG